MERNQPNNVRVYGVLLRAGKVLMAAEKVGGRPPQNWVEDGYRLGTWVNTQRTAHNKGRLDQDRTRRLEDLPNWTWDLLESLWEDGYASLQAYTDREAHARPPATWKENGYRLGSWVSNQRAAHRKGGLDQDKIRRLEDLPGWAWNVRGR